LGSQGKELSEDHAPKGTFKEVLKAPGVAIARTCSYGGEDVKRGGGTTCYPKPFQEQVFLLTRAEAAGAGREGRNNTNSRDRTGAPEKKETGYGKAEKRKSKRSKENAGTILSLSGKRQEKTFKLQANITAKKQRERRRSG